MDTRSALLALFTARTARRIENAGGLDSRRLAELMAMPAGGVLNGVDYERLQAALCIAEAVRVNAPLPAKIDSPRMLGEHYAPRFGAFAQEHVFAVFTSLSGEVCGEKLIGVGTVDSVMADPRDVLRGAVAVDAAVVHLIHNHPGGDPTPSPADVSTTMRVAKACALCGLRFGDHVVVGTRGRWASVGEFAKEMFQQGGLNP